MADYDTVVPLEHRVYQVKRVLKASLASSRFPQNETRGLPSSLATSPSLVSPS